MDLKSRYEAIERLARLRDSGALSEAEFADAKAKLLGGENAEPEAAVVAEPADVPYSPQAESDYATRSYEGEFEPGGNHKWFVAAAVVVLLGGGYWFAQGSKAAISADVISDTAATTKNAVSADPTAALLPRLVGAWAPEGEYCSSGAGYTFKKSGEYVTEDESGRWSTARNTLTLSDSESANRARFNFEQDGTLVTKWDGGSTVRWRKCKPDAPDFEPWFPSGTSTATSEADAALEAAGAAVERAAAAVEQASAGEDSADWRGKKGRCRLKVDGRSFIEGQCWIRLEDGGSFQIMSPDEKYFAKLLRDGQDAEGHWNETAGSTHAQTRLGPMTRSGACWRNDRAQICAWGN